MMTSHKLTKKSYEEFFWIIENELAQVTSVAGTMTLANIRLIGLTVRVRWLTKILGSITFLTALRVTPPLEAWVRSTVFRFTPTGPLGL